MLDLSKLINGVPQFLQSLVAAASVAAIFVLLATSTVARVVLRTLEDFVTTVKGMAEAEYSYPRESRSSREAVNLAQALARIQATLALHQQATANGSPSVRLLENSADVTPRKDGYPGDKISDQTSKQKPKKRKPLATR
ncbi:hypothetical protein [Sulfitobacter noctilucae]|uniref:hypothetical protein n=1 Tax=Sulfitobacter noctilucae TaxID=1342302 RepID=UPI0004694989|nr:hypothetical protein [Sulfitobacter noctilucae]